MEFPAQAPESWDFNSGCLVPEHALINCSPCLVYFNATQRKARFSLLQLAVEGTKVRVERKSVLPFNNETWNKRTGHSLVNIQFGKSQRSVASQQLLLCGCGQAQFLSEDQSHTGPATHPVRVPLGAGVQPVPGAGSSLNPSFS